MKSGTVVLLLTLSLCPLPAGAQTCPIVPRSGPWKAEVDETIGTSFGRFGARDRGGGTAEVESRNCGDSIVLRGGGSEMIFYRGGIEGEDSYSTLPINVGSGSYRVVLKAISREELSGGIRVTGEAAFGLERNVGYTFTGDKKNRPLACECDDPDVLDQVFEQFALEQEEIGDLYANPKYWQQPPGFPEGRNWDAYAYELLINRIIDGMSYEDAAASLAERAKSTNYVRGDSAGPESETAPADASIFNLTCVIEDAFLHEDRCFPYLDLEKTLFHERVHQKRCCPMKKAHERWFRAGAAGKAEVEEPARYSIVVNLPKEAGLEEARAYEATADHLRVWRSWLPGWKQENCPKAKPLPPEGQIPCP